MTGRLPRHDYLLLPLTAFATIVLILLCGEALARIVWVQDASHEPCEINTEGGFRYLPFCTSRTKLWEGPWVTQHFNDCGYPAATSCKPLPPGSLRVVVMGSSTARGALVDYDQSFAGLSSAALTKDCGRHVDFQNLGTEPRDDHLLPARIPEALGLGASAIAIVIGPFDLLHLDDRRPAANATPPAEHLSLRSVVLLLRESRLFLAMQYYLYRDPVFQIHAFLLNGDPADYVRTPLSPAWRQRVADLGGVLKRVASQTEPVHVPVILAYAPERAQAALAAESQWPAGVDPFVLGRALKAESEADGVRFVDTTPFFGAAKDFQSLFYLTDGHPREGGHAAIAQALVPALLALPAFSACRTEQTSEIGRSPS